MIEVSDEVRTAIAERKPVVALESSIIAHGLPFPANVETATALERSVREGGAVPATVAIIDGTPSVGLSALQIEKLGAPEAAHRKAGIGDVAALAAQGASAGTTVSGTALLARCAGIRFFATGGIGGVHRGNSGDVSSDLQTLATTAIAVVSAGPKSILDLPRTAEMLETLGVLVVGFQTAELPAFYSRRSGIALEHSAATAAELAAMIRWRFDTLGQGGALIVNPVPEADEISAEELAPVIADAESSALRAGIRGKALTPYLLAAIRESLGERAVTCNRSLAISNARLAAKIACCDADFLPEP